MRLADPDYHEKSLSFIKKMLLLGERFPLFTAQNHLWMFIKMLNDRLLPFRNDNIYTKNGKKRLEELWTVGNANDVHDNAPKRWQNHVYFHLRKTKDQMLEKFTKGNNNFTFSN